MENFRSTQSYYIYIASDCLSYVWCSRQVIERTEDTELNPGTKHDLCKSFACYWKLSSFVSHNFPKNNIEFFYVTHILFLMIAIWKSVAMIYIPSSYSL